MKFPKTRREVFKLTHFIRIPLLNQTSSTQIQEALFKVARDPVSAAVPSLAYKPFQRMSVSIAALNLPTQESREQAIALLQSLGRREWREVLLKAQAACSVATSSSPSSENLKNENISQQEPQPLVVSVISHAHLSWPLPYPNPMSFLQSEMIVLPPKFASSYA